MSLNHKYYLKYFNTGIGSITLILILIMVKSLFVSVKEAEYNLKIDSNKQFISSYDNLRLSYDSLKTTVEVLQKFVKDQKVEHTNYYNIVSPDKTDMKNFSNKDKYSYWFVFYYSKNGVVGSYGIKIKGSSFNEKKILKKLDPKRNKKQTKNNIDSGGISFFKRISLKEYNNCESKKKID